MAIVANAIIKSYLFPTSARKTALRLLGVRAGRGSGIRAGVTITGPNLTLGDEVFVNFGVVLNTSAGIVLEDGVALGLDVMLTTIDHEFGPPSRRAGEPVRMPIRVGAGTWIGSRALVLPGVTIGSGCIIGAGSVVNRDCEPNGLYVGVPARRVRELS